MALCEAQHGLFTRKQALDVGYSPAELRRLTSGAGLWVVVRRGVYALRDRWDPLDWSGQWLLRDRAANLTMITPHVMSHDSAGRAHGLPMLEPEHPLIHVTRPGVGGSRTDHGVKHHLAAAAPASRVAVDGLSVTGLARTALDIAREHGHQAGVVACDGARRAGADVAEFEAELARMWRWPRVSQATRAFESSDPGAESLAESLTRLLLEEMGLGPVDTQFPVRIDEKIAWCDLRIGCHVFEFDGRIKYRSVEQGGVADRSAEEVLWDQQTRQRLVCAVGLGMSRIVWADLWDAAREACKRRLRAEFAVTVARFGEALPAHLADDAARIRGRRRLA